MCSMPFSGLLVLPAVLGLPWLSLPPWSLGHLSSVSLYLHKDSLLSVYLCLSVSLSSYNRASQAALVVKNPPAHAGDIRDVGSVPGLGRSPGGGHGNPLQCSCLQSPMDRGAWQATIHSIAMSQTRLKRHSVHAFHKIFFLL